MKDAVDVPRRAAISAETFLGAAPVRGALAGTLGALVLLLAASDARAAGFEIPENTTKSVARGGTGAVNKRDPSALYFNPALLPRARGLQVLLNVNLVNLNLEFQRAPLLLDAGTRREREMTFNPVHNDASFFPAPFFTMSYDFGIEDFSVGLGLFGPSGYARRCYGKFSGGDCELIPEGGARYMMVSSELIEAFGSLGAGYTLRLPAGELSLGATAMLAYLDTNFSLAVHGTPTDEKYEKPANDALFYGDGISDWGFTGTFGLAYALEGWRAGVSYRLPMSWEADGTVRMRGAESLGGVGSLTKDGITLGAKQAGVLRAGIGYEGGEHPADARLPRYDVELNVVWEDWSRLKHFKIQPEGKFLLGASEMDLGTLYQEKNYQDSYSLRLGGSYAINEWLSAHAGGYYETAAQPIEYTNVDFVSWDRFAGGLGVTFRLYDHFDLDLAYQHVFMPDRKVTNGRVHQQVPLSGCKAPNYDQFCEVPGTPPGNPQNNGDWSASFQTASVGVTFYYE